VGVDRLRSVHRVVVLAEPAERPAAPPLETGQVDAASTQALHVRLTEVVTDDADQTYRRIQASGDSEVRGRSAQHIRPVLDRRLYVVVRKGANDQDVRHCAGAVSVPRSVISA